jgi:hypothetical protein
MTREMEGGGRSLKRPIPIWPDSVRMHDAIEYLREQSGIRHCGISIVKFLFAKYKFELTLILRHFQYSAYFMRVPNFIVICKSVIDDMNIKISFSQTTGFMRRYFLQTLFWHFI